MVAHKPMTFFEFINAFVKEFPGLKEQVIRQFLESSRYVTVSHDAAEYYKQQYLMRKQYKQKKVNYVDYKKFSIKWAVKRAQLLSKVLDGELKLNHTLTPVYGIKDDNSYFNFNINTATKEDLHSFFSTYFSERITEEERVLHVGKLLKMIAAKEFIDSKDELPFSSYVNNLIHEFNDKYNNYYEAIIQQRFEQVREYSSWSTESKDPGSLINLYKLHY